MKTLFYVFVSLFSYSTAWAMGEDPIQPEPRRSPCLHFLAKFLAAHPDYLSGDHALVPAPPYVEGGQAWHLLPSGLEVHGIARYQFGPDHREYLVHPNLEAEPYLVPAAFVKRLGEGLGQLDPGSDSLGYLLGHLGIIQQAYEDHFRYFKSDLEAAPISGIEAIVWRNRALIPEGARVLLYGMNGREESFLEFLAERPDLSHVTVVEPEYFSKEGGTYYFDIPELLESRAQFHGRDSTISGIPVDFVADHQGLARGTEDFVFVDSVYAYHAISTALLTKIRKGGFLQVREPAYRLQSYNWVMTRSIAAVFSPQLSNPMTFYRILESRFQGP